MTAILGPVRDVDLVVEGGGGILKDDVLVDATSLDVALVAQLSTAKPRGSAPVTGSDVERSSPWRTTQIVTGFRNVPSRRTDAICSSSALPILSSSSLVHVVIGASPFVIDKASLVIGLFIAPSLCHSPARRCGRERTAVYLGLARLNPPAAADYRVLTELERWVLRFPPLAKGLAPT